MSDNSKGMAESLAEADDNRYIYIKFEEIWASQQGALMLKSTNNELEWKKTIANHFFQEGINFVRNMQKIKEV